MTNPVNPEIRNRIKLAVAAYAYEVLNSPFMEDAEYDALSLEIEPWVKTGNAEMDVFFRDEFEADTGMWVHKHPDMRGLHRLYNAYYAPQGDRITPDELSAIEDLI